MGPNSNGCLLNAVTATGIGEKFAVSPSRGVYSLQVKHTGAPASVVVTLKGANGDGQNGFTIGTWDSGSQSNGDIVFIVDKPVALIWASLDTLSGGTNPTVTAHFTAAI